MFDFVPFTYDGQTEPSFTKVFREERMVAVIRPPATGVGHERSDHWRVDCDHVTYEPVVNPALKDAVLEYLGDDRVDIYTHTNWKWQGK